MSNDNVQSNTPEEPVALDLDGAAEAILKNWEDAEKPSEGNLEANDESVETTEESSNENTESVLLLPSSSCPCSLLGILREASIPME